jgi:hypothetical protein
MFKVGQLVSVNVEAPSKWGLVLEVTGVKVYVQWGWKAEWHNQENLKVVQDVTESNLKSAQGLSNV